MVTLTVVSGLGSKGPACFLVETAGRRLLLDLGHGPPPGRLPDVGRVGRVDALLLSHAHRGHAGGLALLPQIGDPPLWVTDPLTHMLHDRNIAGTLPLAGATDVLGVRVRTGRSGHAPGGVWLHLDLAGGLLYMGDHSSESTVYAFDPPPPARTLILDASYGADDTPFAAAARAFDSLFDRGAALLPVPPGARAPEIALHLARRGVLPHLDDAVRQAIGWLGAEHGASAHPEVRAEMTRIARAAPAIDGPRGIILCANADGTGGTSARLLREWEGTAGPEIVFTGYLSAGTPAERLVSSGRAQSMRWNTHPRLSDNVALARAVGAGFVVPAFGDAEHAEAWRAAFAPARVVTQTSLRLS